MSLTNKLLLIKQGKIKNFEQVLLEEKEILQKQVKNIEKEEKIIDNRLDGLFAVIINYLKTYYHKKKVYKNFRHYTFDRPDQINYPIDLVKEVENLFRSH